MNFLSFSKEHGIHSLLATSWLLGVLHFQSLTIESFLNICFALALSQISFLLFRPLSTKTKRTKKFSLLFYSTITVLTFIPLFSTSPTSLFNYSLLIGFGGLLTLSLSPKKKLTWYQTALVFASYSILSNLWLAPYMEQNQYYPFLISIALFFFFSIPFIHYRKRILTKKETVTILFFASLFLTFLPLHASLILLLFLAIKLCWFLPRERIYQFSLRKLGFIELSFCSLFLFLHQIPTLFFY